MKFYGEITKFFHTQKVLIERLVETKIQPWLSRKLFSSKLENEKNKLRIDFEHWPLEDMSFEKFRTRETEIENINMSSNFADDSSSYEHKGNQLKCS